jgi:hypothetical protein
MSLIPFAGAVQKFNRPRGGGGYQIERSLRFNSADSAYLNRTQGSGNRTTWTYSFWIKLGPYTSDAHVFTFNDPANVMYFNTGGQLLWYDGSAANFYLIPTQRFRDFSAWYHIVAVADTNNATQGDRIRLYVNGTRITSFTTANYPTSGYTTGANQSGTTATIGRSTSSFGGYLTEINFIDGQALTPTSFGEFNATTGVWQPKAYEGEYGTNGFYLNFSDNSGTTSSTLGKDQAGSNDWTPNNFSVTAGAGNDSLVDSPTRYGTDTGAGGEVRGNYATLNPLSKTSPATISNGNLDVSTTSSSANISIVAGTIGVSSGKWYWEVVGTAVDSTRMAMYVCDATKYGLNLTASTGAYGYGANGNKIQGDGTNWFGTGSAYGNSWTTNDVIGVALDMDNGKVWFSKNGTWQASGDPAAGTNEAFSGLSGTKTCGMYLYTENAATTAVFNLGQRPFSYTAPSGFKALVTTNLPEPTIEDGGDYFNTVLYTGNASSNAITGVGFQPDWIWIKSRSNGALNHALFDVLRGTPRLDTSTTVVEGEFNQLNTYDTDGFTLKNETTVNESGGSYVAWNWKAGNSNVTNTDGTITSTVRANPTAGFSIVTYTGTGADATVGHGLGVAPAMVIVKGRSFVDNWEVYHSALPVPATDAVRLNTTGAKFTVSGYWNGGTTSSVFGISNYDQLAKSGETFVAYCFAAVSGYSAFGSYVGNGSTDGPFCFTGFRPAFVLRKRTTGTTHAWRLYDAQRDTFNEMNKVLQPNRSDAEQDNNRMDFLSNGFKMRSTDTDGNASGEPYIYMALAENPFSYSLAR